MALPPPGMITFTRFRNVNSQKYLTAKPRPDIDGPYLAWMPTKKKKPNRSPSRRCECSR
jgi:hypothetical protein